MATILLVDDDVDNQAIYRTILEYNGHVVLSAWDGEEAVRLVREAMPEVILMDVTMPRMDGLTATRLLKADAATHAIPIIVLTAHAAASDALEARQAGCDAFLAKPVEPKDVAAEVARVLRG